jgi:predicted membrane protein
MTFEKRIRAYWLFTITLVNLFLLGFILSGHLFGLLSGIILGVLPIALEIHYIKKKGEKINWNNEILIISDISEIIVGLGSFFLCFFYFLETKLLLALIVGIVFGGVYILNALIWMGFRIKKKRQEKMRKEPYQGDSIWHRWESENLKIKEMLAKREKKDHKIKK